ncbi:hypothetical protein ABT352_16730 [Streptosporangium sp. NPDC000563]|uniref:hypothetical protein n=1 Tax=Streptosporangium sp. NPDC000563 TaxID=3154366 RepID=UPI00332FDBB2
MSVDASTGTGTGAGVDGRDASGTGVDGTDASGTDVDSTGVSGVGMGTATLFRELVDDAGLFPPTGLPMAEALERHRNDLAGNDPVLTHRFLCPAGRLGELRDHLTFPIRLGLILDTPDLPPLEDVAVELVEVRQAPGETPGAVWERLAGRLPGDARLFVEVSAGDHASLASLTSLPRDGEGPGLKFRCGGLTAGAFPSAADLGALIAHCARHGVPFKATAGLHNAVRHFDPALGVDRHGFLNLVLAVCAAVEDRDPVPVLKLTDVGELVRLAQAVPDDTSARARELLVSYGSCDTHTPIEDLVALGLIARRPPAPAGTAPHNTTTATATTGTGTGTGTAIPDTATTGGAAHGMAAPDTTEENV